MDALTAMKQALEACRAVVYDYPTSHVTLCDEAMDALVAAIEQTKVIGYMDGRGRFFYASDPWMKRDHSGMAECFATVPQHSDF